MPQKIIVQPLPVPPTAEGPILETIAKRLFPFKKCSDRVLGEIFNNQHTNMELAHLNVGTGFKSFLTELKKLSGASKATVEEASSLLKRVDSGIKSTDEAIKSLKVTKNSQGVVLLGDKYVGVINRILREGDLKKLVSVSKQNIPVTAADSSAFKTLVGATPERGLKNVDDVAAVTKRERPHLDATVENLNKISDTAKRDLKKVENNLYKHFKNGAVVALTVGVVYVGADWISKATEARKGCFMVTTVNGVTTSCKVAAYTCSTDEDAGTGNKCTGTTNYYNTTLVLMNLANAPDDDPNKIAIATATGIAVNQLNAQLANIIDNHYPAVVTAIEKMGTQRPKTFSICDIKNNAVEGGVVPPCRMCDPTANPVSTSFIDPAQYGDNITFQCVTNPSILDTISDTVLSTGKNLWDGVSTVVSGSLKQIGIIAAIILAVLILVMFIVRLFTRKQPEYMDLDNMSVRSQSVVV